MTYAAANGVTHIAEPLFYIAPMLIQKIMKDGPH